MQNPPARYWINTTTTTTTNEKKNIIIIGSAIGGATFIIILIVIMIFFSIKKKRKGKAIKIYGSSVKEEGIGRFDSDSNTEVVKDIKH